MSLPRAGANSPSPERDAIPVVRPFPHLVSGFANAAPSPERDPTFSHTKIESTEPSFVPEPRFPLGVRSMRLHLYARFCALLLFIAPTLVQAQFQEPTKEELQMTSDPKAPGTAAVYLNLQEVTDDELHYHLFYARIKVL